MTETFLGKFQLFESPRFFDELVLYNFFCEIVASSSWLFAFAAFFDRNCAISRKNQHWQHWFHEFFSHFYFSLLFSTHYLALHRVMPHSPEIFVVMQINVFCSINLFIRSNIQSWNYDFFFIKRGKTATLAGFLTDQNGEVLVKNIQDS